MAREDDPAKRNGRPGIQDFWAGSETWPLAEALRLEARTAPIVDTPVVDTPVADERAVLAESGLFDLPWFLQHNTDLAESGIDPLAHYLDRGWREGRRPNAYFVPEWYAAQMQAAQLQTGLGEVNLLLHYIAIGEAAGLSPGPHFDLAWYAAQHQAAPGGTHLAHYLQRRFDGSVSPLPEFDPTFYLTRYPDIAEAGVDPFEHYLLYGYKEGRDPSAEFDTRFYLRRYLDGDLAENPLVHYHRLRGQIRLHPRPRESDGDVFEQVRRFTSPGPDFEERQTLPDSARRLARVLAFYLPQFHDIPENDAWWGRGFTEWTAIERGMPRFVGHYQPRAPRDLGHYTLGSIEDPAAAVPVLRRQIAMAREAGLFGFVQYFYWFNGRRLLQSPLEAFLAEPSLDFPFCLMWANESWTRRWDGSEQDVLIAQDYSAADDAALIDCFARHFRDPRYIRIGGRPLLMIYRADIIPDLAATIARWRQLFVVRHDEHPVLVMAQSFDNRDPRPGGFDGAVEFPPHKLAAALPRQNAALRYLDPAASGHVYAYDDVVAASLQAPEGPFPLIRTAVPSWDNDARRQGAGLVLHGATPAKYQAWLAALVSRAAARPFGADRAGSQAAGAEPFVCINAWNEWAEGAYLEPDVHFGAAYLNATGRAVTQGASLPARGRLLMVGHDAFAAGAQHLLLHLAGRLRHDFGVEVEILLLAGGALLDAYADIAPCRVLTERQARDGRQTPEPPLDRLLADWSARGFSAALVNTAAASRVVPRLEAAGIAATLLVHELPRLIQDKNLLADLREAARAAHCLVFPAASVRDRIAELVPLSPGRCRVQPQGSYRMPDFSSAARARLRRDLGARPATLLVLGAGYGDLRKGFDLFLQCWRTARRRHPAVLFCWIGELDPALRNLLGPEIATAAASGTFRLPGFQQEVDDWYSAADVLALTSREDPFPSIVLEAMAAGLPTVAFEEAGGIPDLLHRHRSGAAVEMADTEAMVERLLEVAAGGARPGERTRLSAIARHEFSFAAYAEFLLQTAHPTLAAISVVVPNYNYARYLPERLASIFAQTHPVREVLLLDDASTDDSVATARRIAADWRRSLVRGRGRGQFGLGLRPVAPRRRTGPRRLPVDRRGR